MEAESNFGLDRNDVLANTIPDPLIPLRWALRCMWIFAALLMALAFSFPVYALLYAAMAVPLAGVYLYASRIVSREDRDYAELFRGRADFDLAEPPLHPDEAAAKAADERLPIQQRKHSWVRQIFPSARPTAVTETVYRPDGTSTTHRFWRMQIASPAHRAECLAMGEHLKAACPEVYRTVAQWWQAVVGDKLAGQIWIGKRYSELSPEGKATIRQRGEVELLAGFFIALRPETWGMRFDARPYFRDFYALRTLLAQRIPDGQRPTAEVITAAPWPQRFRRKQIYLGRGFTVDEEIGTRFYWHKFRKMFPAQDWLARDQLGPVALRLPIIGPRLIRAWRATKRLVLPSYRRQLTLMADAAGDTGARWILGSGWRKLRSIWTHYDRDLPQHTFIGGGSGYGKTVLVQSPLIAAIHNGSSVVWMDPKVDAKTISRVFYHAALAGRLDDIVMVSVSRSDSPYNSTFNPLAGYFDPSQIGNILAGLMPEDAGQNQYFLDDARNIGRIVGTTVHWLNQFLAVLCDGKDVGFHPPRLLLWLEYARSHGLHQVGSAVSVAAKRAEIEDAYTDFTEVWDRLNRLDRSFAPGNATEKTLFAMWVQPEYSPRYWKLSFAHLLEFALNNRQRLVSWFMRLVYPYVCAEDERFSDVLFPRSDTNELVTGYVARPRPLKADEQPPVPLIALYERSGPHLLAPGGLTIADRTKTLWSFLYERDIDVAQISAIQRILERSERSFIELLGQARRDPEEYGQGVANLRPVINEIVAGEKYDLLCVPEPQCTWPVIHEQKKIVIYMLGSMVDQKASDHVSKAIVQSLLGYAGHIQDRGASDIDLLFVADEAPSWMNSTWSHIVDKCRSTGVRTMVLCQSQPGMRHALKSNDLYKHILASIRNVYSCAT